MRANLSQSVHNNCERIGWWALNRNLGVRDGVNEFDFHGGQHQPGDSRVMLKLSIEFRVTVLGIANDQVRNSGHVSSNLVKSSRLRVRLDKSAARA